MTITAVAPDIYQLRLPLPFALNHINCYLLRDDAGWTLLDSGLHTPEGANGWRAAFAELGVDPGQIRQIVLTHFHPDHFGLAGWLQLLSGAPVLMAPREIALAHEVWGESAGAPDPMVPFFMRHGLPPDLAATISTLVGGLRAATRPHPTLTPLAPGATVAMGGRRFSAIHAPGHSDGQLIFYSPVDRLLLSGDHVLIKITPHIGCWPESEPDPLGRYLASLEQLASLDVGLALPGHGRSITDWPGRLAELRQHHAERLAAMQSAVGAGAIAYAVATRVFDIARFTPHELRFAVAETIAHLELLTARGELGRSAGDTFVYYR